MSKHRPRCLNSKAHLLSRSADHNMGHNNNQNMTKLKESWFWGLGVVEINGDLIARITLHNKWDKVIMEAVRDGTEGREKDNRLVTWKEHIYVPLNSSLRSEIIKLNHNNPLAGHLGRDRTKELVE